MPDETGSVSIGWVLGAVAAVAGTAVQAFRVLWEKMDEREAENKRIQQEAISKTEAVATEMKEKYEKCEEEHKATNKRVVELYELKGKVEILTKPEGVKPIVAAALDLLQEGKKRDEPA